MLFRNMLPVGFLAMRLDGEDARIVADYVIPEYRDFKIGVFVYDIKRFVAESGRAVHQRYLRRNGFRPDPAPPELFVKSL